MFGQPYWHRLKFIFYLLKKKKGTSQLWRLWRKGKVQCCHSSPGFCRFIQHTLHTNLGKLHNHYSSRNTPRCCQVAHQTVSYVTEVHWVSNKERHKMCSSLKLTSDAVRCLDAVGKLQKATFNFVISVCLSVRPSVRPSAWNNSASSRRIFMKFDTE